MNLGISEITIIVIQVLLIVGIPLAIVWVGVSLFRRVKSLEARVEKLEDIGNNNTKE